MTQRRLWIAVAFLVVVASCTGRADTPRTTTTTPTPTSTPTPTLAPTPTSPLSPELALQTRCYPVPSILSSDTYQWIQDNCSTITATYVDSYNDRFGKTIIKVTIDGHVYEMRPTSLVSFEPLPQWERGDHLTLMYDGGFQNEVVSFVMMYRQDRLGDYDYLTTTYDWNPGYIYLRRAR